MGGDTSIQEVSRWINGDEANHEFMACGQLLCLFFSLSAEATKQAIKPPEPGRRGKPPPYLRPRDEKLNLPRNAQNSQK